MVNFVCRLDWTKGCQIAGKTLFLVVSVRMFLEEISIWIGGLSKEDPLHQCRWASSNSWRAWIGQKGGGRANFLSLLELELLVFLALGHQCSWFSGLWSQIGTYTTGSSGSQAFGFGLELHHQLPWASSLQMASHSPSLCEQISPNESLCL